MGTRCARETGWVGHRPTATRWLQRAADAEISGGGGWTRGGGPPNMGMGFARGMHGEPAQCEYGREMEGASVFDNHTECEQEEFGAFLGELVIEGPLRLFCDAEQAQASPSAHAHLPFCEGLNVLTTKFLV